MKTVIEMAREAAGDDWGLFQEYMPEIHKLAELVRADEREACAMWAWSAVLSMTNSDIADKVLASIRARGNT